jgi:hypothetical protein
LALAHRAFAAFSAISFRRSGVSDLARALANAAAASDFLVPTLGG